MHAMAVSVSAASSFAPTCTRTAETRNRWATPTSRAACDPSTPPPANPTWAAVAPEHARLTACAARPVWWT